MSSLRESTFEWGDYRPLAAARGSRDLADTLRFGWQVLPRGVALARYEALITARAERTQMVMELARRHGYQAGFDKPGLAEANKFFLRNLPINPDREAIDGTELIDDFWMSVIWDFALVIGEVSISRHPHVRWEFFDPKQRNTLGAYAPSLVGHREGDPTLPFLHLEGYATQICSSGATRVVKAKGVDVPLFPTPVRIDKFVQLVEIEDRLA